MKLLARLTILVWQTPDDDVSGTIQLSFIWENTTSIHGKIITMLLLQYKNAILFNIENYYRITALEPVN